MLPVRRWSRDVSHLENAGFVHWILTKDPVAGLVVQRQAAYALASWYEYKRKRGDRRYHGFDEQERGSYNMLSTAWKARDVSMRVVSRRGSVIWRPNRTEKIAADVIADLHLRRVLPALTAPTDGSSNHVRRIVGLPLRGLGIQTWKTTDGGELKLRGASAFELPQYGKEPLYLWTRAGDPRVAR